ncbi:hypothetical protein N9T73_00410, partial [bacterium]|nr:hypothetical protein [bacterium]
HFISILKNIDSLWVGITYYYIIIIMDIYTVNRLIKYSKETPAIYYSGANHTENCKKLLELFDYQTEQLFPQYS